VLIAIVKKELAIEASLYTCLQVLSVSIFEKTPISCALATNHYNTNLLTPCNQMNLFDF